MSDVEEIIRRALAEDIGPGDATTEACVPVERRAAGRFLARERQVLAGVELIPMVYEAGRTFGLAKPYEIRLLKSSGERAEDGDLIATVTGPARTLLTCERVALNFLQRLSGIATLARQYVEGVAGTGCRILDTRKTTPGLRKLEKVAAAAGGVTNHRMGLYDAILIKNNHIAAAGGVRAAMENARRSGLLIEIEVRTRAELHEALACGARHLLLDNLTPSEAALWIREIDGRAKVELSGGINLDTVRAYAESGADFVSAGAITHSARATDISFRLELT